MKKTLALLVATTALTAAIGLPAWSAMRSEAGAGEHPFAAAFDAGQEAVELIFVSDRHDDDDDDHDDKHRRRSSRDDDDEDDDCDDDDNGCNSARNPAPAGTVAPPSNGLFGNGAPPRVQVN